MRPTALILAAALAALPAMSQAFTSLNHHTVTATGAQEFTVERHGTGGATEYWCAASDYVMRGLGMASTTRIYRTSLPPRKAGQGVSFSLSDKNAVGSGIITFGAQDLGMNAGEADGLCERKLLLHPFND